MRRLLVRARALPPAPRRALSAPAAAAGKDACVHWRGRAAPRRCSARAARAAHPPRLNHSRPRPRRAPPRSFTVTFVDKRGAETVATGAAGTNLVRLAHAFGVELEGACECSLACSTCHVILEPRVYDALPPGGEDEEDLLDLAFGLTPTSRLGCQVLLGPAVAGARIKLPKATRNMYVDGHVPKPH